MRKLFIYILLLASFASFGQHMGVLYSNNVNDTFAHWAYPTGYTTLSNHNLTFTGTTGQFGIAVANIGKLTGKWYWEVYIDFKSVSTEFAGITNYGNPIVPNALILGQTSGSSAWRGDVWDVSDDMAGGGYLQLGGGGNNQVTGQVLSFALDLTPGSPTLNFYVNGAATYSLSLPISPQTYYPACGSDGQSGIGTANFGQNAWDARTAALRTSLSGSGYHIGVH